MVKERCKNNLFLHYKCDSDIALYLAQEDAKIIWLLTNEKHWVDIMDELEKELKIEGRI